MVNMKGQVAAVIIIFLAIIIGITLASKNFPVPKKEIKTTLNPSCQTIPGSEKFITEAAIPAAQPKSRVNCGNSANSSYKLIRVNVPIKRQFFNQDHFNYCKSESIEGIQKLIYYPTKVAASDVWGLKDGFNFARYGVIFTVPLSNPGALQTTKKFNPKEALTKDEYISMDVYQDTAAINDPARGPIPDILFSCVNEPNTTPVPVSTPAPGSAEIIVPSQSPSADHKQLQLEYFVFGEQNDTPVTGVAYTPHCKPAIYLYPEKEMKVNVKVSTKGVLTYTDPPYPVSGWDVIAYPDGKIKIQDTRNKIQTYSYLYYESKVADNLIDIPSSGYTVSFDKLVHLYQTVLPSLGLNPTQIDDFISYWSKALPYSPYYFVGILDQTNINEIEPLEITPKPDTINRVRVYFKPLDKKPALSISEPISSSYQLPPTTYNLFKVTEWGGMVKTDPLHPFTCSQ